MGLLSQLSSGTTLLELQKAMELPCDVTEMKNFKQQMYSSHLLIAGSREVRNVAISSPKFSAFIAFIQALIKSTAKFGHFQYGCLVY